MRFGQTSQQLYGPDRLHPGPARCGEQAWVLKNRFFLNSRKFEGYSHCRQFTFSSHGIGTTFFSPCEHPSSELIPAFASPRSVESSCPAVFPALGAEGSERLVPGSQVRFSIFPHRGGPRFPAEFLRDRTPKRADTVKYQASGNPRQPSQSERHKTSRTAFLQSGSNLGTYFRRSQSGSRMVPETIHRMTSLSSADEISFDHGITV